MIARSWDGVTPAAQADEYADYVQRTGITDLVATDGNLGVYLLRRREGDRARFRVLSLWESMEGIRRFAGDDPEKARYYPEDRRFLLALEPNVEHFDVVAAGGRGRTAARRRARPASGEAVRDHQLDRAPRREAPGERGVIRATGGAAPPAAPRARLDVHRTRRVAIAMRVRIRIGETRYRGLPRSPCRQFDSERAVEAAHIRARQRAGHAARSAPTFPSSTRIRPRCTRSIRPEVR